MKKLSMYCEIAKSEELDDGTIKVSGYASSNAVDSDGETITADAMKAALPDYMKFGAVREMHQAKAAGTAVHAEVQADGRTFFVAHIVDSEAVKKVKAGVYKGFSIGGKATSRDDLNKSIITGLRLVEVSLVDRPANPEAVFSMFKADGIDDGDDGVQKVGDMSLSQVSMVENPVYPGAVAKAEPAAAIDELAALLDSGAVTPEKLLALAKGEAVVEGKPASGAAEGEAQADTSASADDATKAAAADDVQKGMYDVQRFAELLQGISYLASSATIDELHDTANEKSPLPAGLRAWVAQGAELFVAMAKEETDEMMQRLADLSTSKAEGAGDIAKAGARYSAETKKALGELHGMIQKCSEHMDGMGYKDAEGDAEKADASDDLRKVSGELDVTKAELNKLATEKAALEKRVSELEALPAAGKALLKAIGKGDDVGEPVGPNVAPVTKFDGTVDEAASLIKAAHATGGKPLF